MNDEHRIHGQEQAQQQSIQKGLMVGHDQQPGAGENRRVAGHPDPEQPLNTLAEDLLDDGAQHDVRLLSGMKVRRLRHMVRPYVETFRHVCEGA
ncbi:hypothetical protein SDC9_168736 [bioreactor metagenome]|uniref:Uncharacterized protein n=1 Tax=bioreactor metagenome TaxID=1076179 RepID=A0A645G391_9ZZZZ